MRLSEEQLLQIQDMLDEFHLLASDVTEQLGACFLRNDETPTRYDGNHVRRIRLPEGVTVDDFFAEVERFYSYQNFRAIRTDPWTRPLGIEARLLQDGYGHSTEIVLATQGPIGGRPAEIEIVTLEGEAGWAALRDLIRHDEEYEGQGEQIFRLVRRRGDAFTWFLAIADGKVVGHFSERTRDGIGYLEDLVVLPEYRLRGIATALVHRAAASARSKGAELVFLPADANDTPKEMYRRMGFEPVYAFRNYHRVREA
jgi:GNAT superfamily N-acetyltransferase